MDATLHDQALHDQALHEQAPAPANGAAPPAQQPPAFTGGKRVYVGNLSWDTRWQGLKDHMRDAGEVVHAEVFTEASGRSAGCGIVEFQTPDAAGNAITTLNDSVLDGRTIFVRADREEGKPRSSRFEGGGEAAAAASGGGSGGNSYGGRGGSRPSDRGRKIVVWNLPYHIRWQDLKDLFRDYGNVIRADVPQTHDGKSKGMGTVLFETEVEAERAIQEMTGKEVDGRVVDCRLDKFA